MWSEQDPKNDQTASAFRKAGVVLMVISLRGGNDNPGDREGLYGEIDDVKAAGDYLARQPYVDPARIYVGGHSTGASLVLLTQAATTQFRAAFAFGPIATPVRNYMAAVGVQVRSQEDLDRRAPVRFLNAVATPTFIVEGEDGNAKAFAAMRAATTNPNLRFHLVPRATHFTVLGPVSAIVAKQILKDTGPTPAIVLNDADLAAPFKF
jgi:alpha/beta superfamily hydrolase